MEILFFEIKKLKNLTTEINLLKNHQDDRAEAIEFDNDHIVIDCAEKSCAKGQLVDIDGMLHYVSHKVKFNATGKIVNIKPSVDNRVEVTVELHSFNKEEWKTFVTAQRERQENLDKVFRSLKGE